MENRTPLGQLTSAGLDALHEVADDPGKLAEFLRLQGRVFKHGTSIALAFYAQNTGTQFIATREQWERMHYTVKQGADALHYVGNDGKNHDLYGFSQIEEDKAPSVWTINKKNAAQVQQQLGVAQGSSIMIAALRQTVLVENVTNCMKALQVPPNEYKQFQSSYVSAVQSIMAGRLEMGGGRFPVTLDTAAFDALKTDEQRFAFLSLAAKDARAALRS